jgi:hypothetical protein
MIEIIVNVNDKNKKLLQFVTKSTCIKHQVQSWSSQNRSRSPAALGLRLHQTVFSSSIATHNITAKPSSWTIMFGLLITIYYNSSCTFHFNWIYLKVVFVVAVVSQVQVTMVHDRGAACPLLPIRQSEFFTK